MSSTISISDNLRKVNTFRESIVKCLAPSNGDYIMGGSHRCWVKECALLTVEKVSDELASLNTLCKTDGNKVMTITINRKIAIPMPPAWDGVRPTEIEETYGHSATKMKDWRHFENTLRYGFAKRGFICDTASADDGKAVQITVATMMNVAMFGTNKAEADTKMFARPAECPTKSYDEWCSDLDKVMESSESGAKHDYLSNFPPAIRPMVAMSM